MKRVACLLAVFLYLLCIHARSFADTIKLPSGLVEIEEEAFYQDTSITEVEVPAGTKRIGARAFANSGLRRIFLPDTIEEIDPTAFDNLPQGFVTVPIRTESMTIDGKNYTATYFGQRDISSWDEPWYEKYSYQDFWRIENAYEDFKDYKRFGGNYPGIMYPMPVEAGQVYVIDYTLKSGGTERRLMRCDGDIFEPAGGYNTFAIRFDVPPIRTETMTINGKNYSASYFGQVDISSWHQKYSCRDFWRLENAYEDFKACRLTGEYLPESNYPMPVEAGQVYVIDYTLKSGGIDRRLMRCDGDIYEPEGRPNTHAFVVN